MGMSTRTRTYVCERAHTRPIGRVFILSLILRHVALMDLVFLADRFGFGRVEPVGRALVAIVATFGTFVGCGSSTWVAR